MSEQDEPAEQAPNGDAAATADEDGEGVTDTQDGEEPTDERAELSADERAEEAPDVEGTDLVKQVAAADETLAAQVEAQLAELEAEAAEYEQELDERTSQLRRAQADFQNYKKRAKKRQQQLEAQATEDLVERLLDVRDDLKRALADDHDDSESIREGVEMTLREFDRVLEGENVSEISPEAGSEVDPERHEVLMRVESDQPEGSVADVYQPGYEMSEKVLRPAQVTVSDETTREGTTDGETADGETGDAETTHER